MQPPSPSEKPDFDPGVVLSADTVLGPALQQRADLMSLVAVAGWTLNALRHVLRVGWFWVPNDIFVIASTLLARWMWQRDPRNVVMATQIGLAAAALHLMIEAWFDGQSTAPAAWFLACVPIVASFLLGRRSALVWTVLVVAGVLAIDLIGLVHPMVPINQDDQFSVIFCHGLLIVITWALAGAMREAHDNYLLLLAQQATVIREQAEVARQQAVEVAEARDQALSAAAAKSHFLAVMSHEIRTPLNGLIGLTQVLQTTPLKSDQADLLRTVAKSEERLLAVVNSILDFSKLEAKGLELESSPFDVRECIDDVLDVEAGNAWKKGVELVAQVDVGTPTRVRGDALRVAQVVSNLVANAVKFTPTGEVRVHVSPSEKGGLHVAVQDSGIGIPADRLSGLFTPFTQVDASTSRRYGGTGLGLVICRSLVELMGGTIWVESTPDVGTTFHFTLPLEAEASASPETVGWGGGRVLLLGPGSPTARALTDMLRGMGVDVTVDETHGDPVIPWAAVFILARHAEAGTLATQLKQQGLACPVLLVTSTADTDLRPRSAQCGYDGVMLVPVRRTRVEQALHLVEGRPVEGPLHTAPAPPAPRSTRSILVAEDDELNRLVAQALLAQLGYQPDFVDNGAAVLEALRARPYDVVLMDMEMPVMDGLEATRCIRQDFPAEQQPRIVALTANAQEEHVAIFKEAGADQFLAKPYTLAVLRATLDRLLTAPP